MPDSAEPPRTSATTQGPTQRGRAQGSSQRPRAQANPLFLREDELRRAMELMFFAYRDFTGVADEILADYGFGRAHHRVIYFVGAHPGISVSELLAILKITKQSLNRVLSVLIDQAFIAQEQDVEDRRRRLLRLTAKGRELERRLTERQSRQIARAYLDAGAESVAGFRAVLGRLIAPEDRPRVLGDRAPEA